jgi:hypothetical protein
MGIKYLELAMVGNRNTIANRSKPVFQNQKQKDMTPKEKAEELIKRYYRDSDLLVEDLSWIQAKECAIIACRELKRQWIELTHIKGPAEATYWDSVKEEIKKL